MLKKLKDAIKDSMKAGSHVRTNTLRSILATSQSIALADCRKELVDSDILTSVTKGIKQRNDSLTMFKDAGRDDLAKIEEFELNVYKEYLPKQLTEDEVVNIIDEAITKTGASTKKQMGLIMKEIMPVTKGKFDGKKISQMVSAKLA